ncbi:MAG: hypothetical protein CMA28_02595 [Euryarchaeota archaeon]|jgi:predicted nucleic acid-binding Zn ribbon protein|nr:hypothetical protein [Euryarchaeota archaeon]
MTSRKDIIMKAAKRTAKQAQVAASRRTPRTRSRIEAEPHRHCVVCWKPISLESEPAICNDLNCETVNERRERSRKRWAFLMYSGVAIFVGMLVIQVVV